MENEKKLSFNQEMTESDIKKAIELLREAIKRKIITFKHANPIKENCYISSGYISGLYFPNSEIILNNGTHKYYNFVCIAKIDFKLCFVYSLKEEGAEIFKSLKEYTSDPIESVLYSYDERQIIDNFNSHLRNYNDRLKQLLKIERVKTKAGEDFKRLQDNFKNCSLSFSYEWNSAKISSYKINGVYFNISDPITAEELTADYIQNRINEEIKRTQAQIKQIEKAQKNTYANYKKMLALKEKCISFFKSLEYGEYTYKEQFKKML